MNNVKKVIAVMTAGAMVLGVGAQGVFAESQEDEVVELIYWKSYNVDVYKDFINQFNEEHPNIHVTAEIFPDHCRRFRCKLQQETQKCRILFS